MPLFTVELSSTPTSKKKCILRCFLPSDTLYYNANLYHNTQNHAIKKGQLSLCAVTNQKQLAGVVSSIHLGWLRCSSITYSQTCQPSVL